MPDRVSLWSAILELQRSARSGTRGSERPGRIASVPVCISCRPSVRGSKDGADSPRPHPAADRPDPPYGRSLLILQIQRSSAAAQRFLLPHGHPRWPAAVPARGVLCQYAVSSFASSLERLERGLPEATTLFVCVSVRPISRWRRAHPLRRHRLPGLRHRPELRRPPGRSRSLPAREPRWAQPRPAPGWRLRRSSAPRR